jgi:hypothetical protein
MKNYDKEIEELELKLKIIKDEKKINLKEFKLLLLNDFKEDIVEQLNYYIELLVSKED